MTQENKIPTFEEAADAFFNRKETLSDDERELEDIMMPPDEFNQALCLIDQMHKSTVLENDVSPDHVERPWAYIMFANGPKTREALSMLSMNPIVLGDEDLDKRYIFALAPILDMDAWAEDRHKYMYDLGAVFGRVGAIAVGIFLFSEAWMVKSPKLKEEGIASMDDAHKYSEDLYKQYKSLGDHPDRQEVLMVSGLSMDGKVGGVMTEFTRENNRYVLQEMNTTLYGTKLEGEKDQAKGMAPYLLFNFIGGFGSEFHKRLAKEKIQ